MSENRSPIPSRLYNAAQGGHVCGADDIIDDETGLTLDKVAGGALEKKEYTSGSDNGMGRVVLRKNLVEGVNTLTQSMINKNNTIYVIQYDFTLGEDINVPANCILEFNGGSIGDGLVYLNNNCVVCGKGKYHITDKSYYPYRDIEGNDQEFRAGFVIEGKQNISIQGILFDYDNSIEGSVRNAKGVLCYGLRNHPVKEVYIKDCEFTNCSVAFFNNTENSRVTYCNFNGSSYVFNNETCYDYEGKDNSNLTKYNGWKCCKNNIFAFNNVKNTWTSNPYPLIWCSGIDGLDIIYNNFDVCTDLMYIYCGDGNVSLKDAYIANNNIILRDSLTKKDTIYSIDVCGISWIYPRQNLNAEQYNEIQHSSCVIESNTITSEITDFADNKYWWGIRSSFMDIMKIGNNIIDGFCRSIVTQNVRTKYPDTTMRLMKGDYLIINNIFTNYYDRPLLIDDNTLSSIIKDNIFKNTPIKSYITYWSKYLIDIAGKINISFIGNKVLKESGFVLFWTKDGNNNTVKGNLISYNNIGEYGELFNGFYSIIPNDIDLQRDETFHVGSLAKEWFAGDLTNINTKKINTGQTIIADKFYYVKEGGLFGNISYNVTLGANPAGTNEVIYTSNNGIIPGHVILIGGVEYIVMNIYTKTDYYKYENGNYSDIVSIDILVLNKPLTSAVEAGTIASTKSAVLVDASGDVVNPQ